MRARLRVAFITALGLLVLVALSGAIVGTYRDNDFFQFWAGPHALLEGASPYDFAWSSAFHARYASTALHQPSLPPQWTTAYPLWTFVLLLPLGLLPFEVAAPAWLALQAAAIAIGIAFLVNIALRTAPLRDRVVLGGFALAFQPAWVAIAGGNITGALFGLLVGAIAAARADRPRLAGALLGLLIVKPQAFLLVAIAFVVASHARGKLLAGAAAVAMPLVLVSFALRPTWLPEWLRMSAALQSSTVSNATLWTLDRAVVSGSVVAPALLALLIAVVAWWWAVRRPTPHALIAATIPVSLLAAPRGWSYDELHLLVTVAATLEAFAASTSRLAWLAGLAAVTVVGPWVLYAVAFSRGGEELSVLTPLLLFAFFLGADARIGARRPSVSPSSVA